ncbi:Hypothetical predicted protein [Mytilus galloprovincialis]|uniref:Abasic site processing protein HMCES n=1 Tax=Mytilus galloprovincialis TaxID=29158 RepID=A0A8B6EZU3_MYTGA|nr:Hypothetical predicted protein [Mytilus galloprovincialis]
MGNVLLCGDFNARIANSPDYILNDDQSYLPLFDNYPIDKQTLKRQSSDTTIDSRGKSLLDLCILNQLRILNGRVLGDVFGKYTCYTPTGSSVVDYVMVSESILDQILYFYVHNFMPTISDCHCILEWEMSSKFTVDDNDCNINMFDKSPNFIWSDESPTNFQTALLLPDIQTQIDTFNKSIIKESQSSVDEAAAELSHIFLSAATNSLKRNKLRNKKIKTKKWFDGDLYHLRNKLISYGKIYSKFPYDPLVRGHYYKLNKQYSKLRKFKYKEYKKSLVEQLQNLHDDNPKSYWKLINDLKNNDNKDHSSAVAPSVALEPDDICKSCSFKSKTTGKGRQQPVWRDPPGGQKYYPSYNVAPGSHTPVLISSQHYQGELDTITERVIQPMRWGLVPSWHKGDPTNVGYETNNCRAEGMLEKKTYKVPLEKGRRCVVLADG